MRTDLLGHIRCCLLMLFAINISNLSAQEIQDSARIHFRQGNTELEMELPGNRKSLEKITSRIFFHSTDSNYLLRKVQFVGAASPEGSVGLNRELSRKRANSLFRYISAYTDLSDTLLENEFIGRDWKRLLDMVQADTNVPGRPEVLRLLRKLPGQTETGENAVLDELKKIQGGEPYDYMYRRFFPELRSSLVKVWYEAVRKPSLRVDTVYIHTHDTLYFREVLRDTLRVLCLPEARPFPMAIKTNLLYDALLIPNIGLEFSLGKKWSLSANWMYSWWHNDRTHNYWRIYGGDIELRKWFGRTSGGRLFTGHHAGVYAQILTYDFKLGARGYLGDKWSYGAGFSYGYSFPVAKRLNMDFSLGLGYLGGKYKEYVYDAGCYVWQVTRQRKWFGPTKAEISLVWLLGKTSLK